MSNFKTNTIYNLSDLIVKGKMPSFKDFKNKVFYSKPGLSFWMTKKTLQKLYAFIKVIQLHPKRNELAFALKDVFNMVLNNMVSEYNYFSQLITYYPKIYKNAWFNCYFIEKFINNKF